MNVSIPELSDGEVYAGAIIKPDGSGHHIILLKGVVKGNWDECIEWAKGKGGDLPSRPEQAILHANLRDYFKIDWYWSNTQHAADCAWSQYFGNGYQYGLSKSYEGRARAVRRVEIKSTDSEA